MGYLIDYCLMDYCCYCFHKKTYFVRIVVHHDFGNYYFLLEHDAAFVFSFLGIVLIIRRILSGLLSNKILEIIISFLSMTLILVFRFKELNAITDNFSYKYTTTFLVFVAT